jgi:hypothetical protein
VLQLVVGLFNQMTSLCFLMFMLCVMQEVSMCCEIVFLPDLPVAWGGMCVFVVILTLSGEWRKELVLDQYIVCWMFLLFIVLPLITIWSISL